MATAPGLDGFCEHLKKKGFSSSQIEIEETYNDYRLTYNRVTAALQSDNPPAAIYMANRSVTGLRGRTQSCRHGSAGACDRT